MFVSFVNEAKCRKYIYHMGDSVSCQTIASMYTPDPRFACVYALDGIPPTLASLGMGEIHDCSVTFRMMDRGRSTERCHGDVIHFLNGSAWTPQHVPVVAFFVEFMNHVTIPVLFSIGNDRTGTIVKFDVTDGTSMSAVWCLVADHVIDMGTEIALSIVKPPLPDFSAGTFNLADLASQMVPCNDGTLWTRHDGYVRHKLVGDVAAIYAHVVPMKGCVIL